MTTQKRKEQKKEYAKIYYEKHREKILARCKKRYEGNTEKMRQDRKDYYNANKDKARERSRKEFAQVRGIFAKLKSSGCILCGYNKCVAALEFHHLDPSKKEHKLSQVRSLETIMRETAKCIVICANCHREIHSK
jgi:hypothetical protein